MAGKWKKKNGRKMKEKAKWWGNERKNKMAGK